MHVISYRSQHSLVHIFKNDVKRFSIMSSWHSFAANQKASSEKWKASSKNRKVTSEDTESSSEEH